jgi:hypothetical protein
MGIAGAQEAAQKLDLVRTFRYPGGSDIDFDGPRVYASQLGSEGRVHVIDTSGRKPTKMASVRCPGDQNDIAVVEPGLIAIGQHTGGLCLGGELGGVRLIDVQNPERPRYLDGIELPGGTHTITMHPEEDLLYASGGTGVERILDVSDPARIRMAGRYSENCHDLSFDTKSDSSLAFCAQGDKTTIWDVKEPRRPRTIGTITNPLMDYHHSAVASPDGDLLIVGDETQLLLDECGSGKSPKGALWAYDISDPRSPVQLGWIGPPRGWLVIAGLPGIVSCTAHNYNFIPGSRTLVTSWATGGTSVIDFSDPSEPRETAFYQRMFQSSWSSYWYQGRIYANGSNGLDVLQLP